MNIQFEIVNNNYINKWILNQEDQGAKEKDLKGKIYALISIVLRRRDLQAQVTLITQAKDQSKDKKLVGFPLTFQINPLKS